MTHRRLHRIDDARSKCITARGGSGSVGTIIALMPGNGLDVAMKNTFGSFMNEGNTKGRPLCTASSEGKPIY